MSPVCGAAVKHGKGWRTCEAPARWLGVHEGAPYERAEWPRCDEHKHRSAGFTSVEPVWPPGAQARLELFR